MTRGVLPLFTELPRETVWKFSVTHILSQTAKDLADMRAAEWMSAKQAARHLGCESVKAFEKIAAREGIPKHYLSTRAPATIAPNSTLGSWSAEKDPTASRN